MYIGLISDTHGTFDRPFMDFLKPVDEIWHAGDFGSLETAQAIASFKPMRGVYGNIDGYDIRMDYPMYQLFGCCGMKVLMIRALIDEHRPDLFVCGHSHILKVMPDRKRDMMVLNPGAAGIYGFHLVRTALRFHIDGGEIHDMEVFELDKDNGKPVPGM